MKRFSRVCTGIMLALFLLFLDTGLLLGTLGQLPHRSYTAALLAAVFCAGGLLLLTRRSKSLFERWGARRTGLMLALFCFALNLVWVLWMRSPIYGDAKTYWDTALMLAAGEPLDNAALLALFPHILGYSCFLAPFLRLFGAEPLTAYVLNVCLCTLSGLLLYRLALRFGSVRQAGWAFLLWGLCPSKMLYNGMVLSDGLYTCLLLGALSLFAAWESRGLPNKLLIPVGLLAGMLLWIVNSCRPIAVIVPIALFLWCLFLRGEWRHTGRWLLVLVLLLLAYVPLGRLWNAHLTEMLGEQPVPVPGYNIYVGFNAETGGTYSEEDMDLLTAFREQEGSAIAAQERMMEAAKARIFSGSIRFPRLFAEKLRSLLGSDEGGAYALGHAGAGGLYERLAVMSNLVYYTLILLANVGVRRLWLRRERRVVLILPLYALGLILAQLLVEVSSRYHYSVLPVLALLAALGLTQDKGGESYA